MKIKVSFLGVLLFAGSLCSSDLSQEVDSDDQERLIQLESENQQLIEMVYQLEQERDHLGTVIESLQLENHSLYQRLSELESLLGKKDAFDSDDDDAHGLNFVSNTIDHSEQDVVLIDED